MPTTVTLPITDGAQDGYINSTSAPVYSGQGYSTHVMSSFDVVVGKSVAAGSFYSFVGLLSFNTASIPDTAQISSAIFRFYTTRGQTADGRDLVGERYNWTGPNAASDFTLNPVGAEMFSRPISQLTTIGTRYDIPITSPDVNISKTAVTKIRLLVDGGSPTDVNEVQIAGFENPNYPPPELIVTYAVPPVANFTVSGTGLTRTFMNTSSKTGGTIASSLWDFGDNSTDVTTTSPTHQFPGNGTFAVKLTVTDNEGLTSTKTTNVVISAPGPLASFTVAANGLYRTFTNTSTARGAPIVSSLWDLGDNSPDVSNQHSVLHKYVPGTYTVTLKTTDGDGLTGTATKSVVVANPAPPPTPTWKNLAQFQVVPTNFTFQGNIPKTNADSPIEMVHLQIYRTDTGEAAYDQEFEVTPEERTQGYFSRAPVTLDPDATYRAKFRTKDGFNQYSLPSIERTFDVSIGPDSPTLTAPLGKINTITGYNYQGAYSHPDLLSSNAIQIEIRTQAGTAIIYDSTPISITVANGATWSIAEFHPDLSWATNYTWKARLRDTADAWGAYSLLRAFKTNSSPSAPTSLSPASGASTDSRSFSCAVSDPDGDAITAVQIEISNAATGAIIAGYPKQMTVSADSKTATFTALTTDLVLGTSYRFRCRATDGFSPGYGGWSGYSTFTYRAGPSVTLLSPASAQRRNLVSEPSAEYARGTYWSEIDRGGLTDKNLLSANQSSPEIDLTGWTAPTASITRSANYAAYKTYSVALSCSLAQESATPRIHLTLPVAPQPNTDYAWQVEIYLPVATYLNLNQWALRENATAGQSIGRASDVNAAVLYQAGWHTVGGAGTTSASPGTSMVLFMTHARKADNSAYDSTKTIYFDKAQVEFGLTSTVWDLGSSGAATGHIDTVGDGDGASGSYAWEAIESSGSTNAFRGPLQAVSASKPYLMRAAFKKLAGNSLTHLKVLCYNSAGTLLGTLYPSSIAAANATNVPLYWQNYGGIIWPVGSVNSPRLVSTTTHVQIEIVPSAASPATVRFDAVSLEEVPLVPGSVEIDWTRLQASFGYFDGSTQGYGEGGYRWSGIPGASESVGLNVQTSPSMFAYIVYVSAGYAKAEDRLTIEVWDAVAQSWTLVNVPTWVASNRTFIPLPTNLLRNERRYRILVEARDTQGGIGNSGYVEFDTFLDGPPQLTILSATPNPESATIDLMFKATFLPPTQFGGIEVMVRPTDDSEPTAIVVMSQDTGTTRATYHFPVSGKEYELSVRQKRIFGLDNVAGKWSTARVICTYPYPVLKDAEYPSLYVAYDVPPQSYEQDAPGETFFPWGSRAPVHLLGEMRIKSGTEEVALYEEPGLIASADERWQILKQILERRRTICLLMQHPEPDKVFGAIIGGASFGLDNLRKKVVSFDWEQTFYSEDYYERGG